MANTDIEQMDWNDQRNISIAILDLYEGAENQGMRCIRTIIKNWAADNGFTETVKEFDVRLKNEVPDTSYDVYISTGGPGSPLDSVGSKWEEAYFGWLSQMEDWNNGQHNFPKKHVFFICHSFQLVCRHYNLGFVSPRAKKSFGVHPVHIMEGGENEPIFDDLKNPFYAVDSREFQVTKPNFERIREMGGQILALEKLRTHVLYERALMAIRINEYFVATQFHPEADAEGMSMYLQREDKKQTVIENHGVEKWKSMIEHLKDPNKISYTYDRILPNFLNLAVGSLVEA